MHKFIHSSKNGAFTYCYLASEADTRIADLELAAKENARYSTEMREEFERRGTRIAELEKQVEELQLALHFWLPCVPEEGDLYIINRIGDHAMLLNGLNA